MRRRDLLIGLAASLVAPGPARAASAVYVAARFTPGGGASVAAFDLDGRELFSAPLDARGHDIALHPFTDDLVVFARRPGTFAVVMDRTRGAVRATIRAAAGRHFYGHGAFSANGALLYATENDFEAGEGTIGVYDVKAGYQRVDEWPSHGVGPHDLRLLPDGQTLVVANGGIKTHPATGRDMINRDTMRPSIVTIDARSGALLTRVTLPETDRWLSLRHLALTPEGTVMFGGQWEGEVGDTPFLVGSVTRAGETRLFEMPDGDHARLTGYIGSVAFDARSGRLAATAPRGGVVAFFSADGRYLGQRELPDVCGVAPLAVADGFVVTSGNSGVRVVRSIGPLEAIGGRAFQAVAWDNHAVALG